MASHDSVKKTFIVAFLLCIFFSVVVSAAAVALSKPQAENKERDRQKNILVAAGLYEPGVNIQEKFSDIETRVIDLKTDQEVKDFPIKGYNDRKAAKDASKNIVLDKKEDIANIKTIASKYVIYLVKSKDGQLTQVILPIFGKGLWSTMYGFMALNKDIKTVSGITFYEHGETPGLGGEIENPRWQNRWKGKAIYDNGELEIQVIKGEVNENTPDAEYKVDGLAGATITGRGVSHTVRFWLSDSGFGQYLKTLRSELGLPPIAKATVNQKDEN